MATLYFTREFTTDEVGMLEMYTGRIFGPTLESCLEQVRRDFASRGERSYRKHRSGASTTPSRSRTGTTRY